MRLNSGKDNDYYIEGHWREVGRVHWGREMRGETHVGQGRFRDGLPLCRI